MSRFDKTISSPRVTIALFIVAAILLIVSAIGGTRAALTYFSDSYVARLSVSNIGVTLLENGNQVAYRNYAGDDKWDENSGKLLQNMVPQNSTFNIGQSYPEAISVQNTGTVGQYVRVTIRKYWENGDGSKVRTVSPDTILLSNANTSDWVIDTESSTDERTVYYYTKPLAQGELSSALSSTITISPSILNKVTQESKSSNGFTTITTNYDYNGLRFCLEAEVDAVQEHNAVSAIKSAWGKNVSISNGRLKLA